VTGVQTCALPIYYVGALIAGGLAYLATMRLLQQPVRFGLKRPTAR